MAIIEWYPYMLLRASPRSDLVSPGSSWRVSCSSIILFGVKPHSLNRYSSQNKNPQLRSGFKTSLQSSMDASSIVELIKHHVQAKLGLFQSASDKKVFPSVPSSPKSIKYSVSGSVSRAESMYCAELDNVPRSMAFCLIKRSSRQVILDTCIQ